jgi:uncharacterized membrane protein YdfJ with MMPL/SSD domain
MCSCQYCQLWWQLAVASTAVLVALGIPFTQMRFTTAVARVLPQSASPHQVQSTLDSHFPPKRSSLPASVRGAVPRSLGLA